VRNTPLDGGALANSFTRLALSSYLSSWLLVLDQALPLVSNTTRNLAPSRNSSILAPRASSMVSGLL
jgi:hypothetical protein